MRTSWLVALLLTCLSAKGQNSPVTNTRTSAGYAAIQTAIDVTEENGTCTYPKEAHLDYGCIENCGDADLDNDGQVTTTDILAMLTVFGTFCDRAESNLTLEMAA